MTSRFFTPQEVNELLPTIRPLMADLLDRWAWVAANKPVMMGLLGDHNGDIGGSLPTEMALEFTHIERLIRQIRAFGCEVKDLNVGLLDFLSVREGREVYLCWRYNEPTVAYYHELHGGFNGRRKL